MAANLLRAVTRHEPDNQCTRDRRRDHPRSEMMILQVGENGGKALEENDIGQLRNKPEKHLRHDRADRANRDGQPNQDQHSAVGSKIPQERMVGRFLRLHFLSRSTTVRWDAGATAKNVFSSTWDSASVIESANTDRS